MKDCTAYIGITIKNESKHPLKFKFDGNVLTVVTGQCYHKSTRRLYNDEKNLYIICNDCGYERRKIFTSSVTIADMNVTAEEYDAFKMECKHPKERIDVNYCLDCGETMSQQTHGLWDI